MEAVLDPFTALFPPKRPPKQKASKEHIETEVGQREMEDRTWHRPVVEKQAGFHPFEIKRAKRNSQKGKAQEGVYSIDSPPRPSGQLIGEGRESGGNDDSPCHGKAGKMQGGAFIPGRHPEKIVQG